VVDSQDRQASSGTTAAPEPGTRVTVKWDDTKLTTSYANVANVASTREEVVLLFGINQAWRAGQTEIPVQLSDRIVLSPMAAKRMSILLQNVLREYETRFGVLPDPRAGA
jgi:hypothetical protein